ncbi:hypoxanthine-guanine phosphoribosyltransferase [Methylophilus aquaticus]|uniref:Hypoxanthine-guanine phosphoribosyltransferase n=1 Tax=Methylophilus aquaticus TaxID=1971610 RepID=A0ABT9JVA3_9PROT|nr:hypoxanthine-guanine phosphoribosyltransferase [Methylophilus aquaticus]MDP8568389.1 hypoxanthine-guanine phosphoribosyltransferase [Methylophilus aquaticus]
MTTVQAAEHWLQLSEVVYTASEVDIAINTMMQHMQSTLPDEPIVMMCVMRGGLYLSARLMAGLRCPLQLDYLQANRYHGLSGSQVDWSKHPDTDLQGRIVLVVDDILDEGITLAEVVNYCKQAGAKQVFTAVLTEKDNGLQKPLHADFVGLVVPNRYVFGCGMDVYGWWRNLPEIRALTQQA